MAASEDMGVDQGRSQPCFRGRASASLPARAGGRAAGDRVGGGRVAGERDLAEGTGLPLSVDEAGGIHFHGGLPSVTPQVRTIDDMRAVLYNQTATGPSPLYFMYRGLAWPEDASRLATYSLRFDLTVLVPGLVGGELVKTAGHYHPAPGPGTEGPSYPELYQVVAGRAHYLLQLPRGDRGSGVLADVVVIEAGPGDVVYVPPDYGHVTINAGEEPLVMVNAVDASFSSVYGPYRERHGAAYYEIEEGGKAYLVANDHYPELPQPRLCRPTDPATLGLEPGKPVYPQLAADPRSFSFLTEPRGGVLVP